MKTKILFTMCAYLIVASSSSQASAVAEGTEELRLNSHLELNTMAGTRLGIGLGYGYFIADYIEVGTLGGYSDDDFVTDLYGGAFGELNFETGTELVPFAGAQISLHYADVSLMNTNSSATAVVIGIYTGAKYFLTEMVAVSGRLLLEVATDDVFVDKNKATDSNFTIDLGFNFYF